jgi:hypothetical protein
MFRFVAAIALCIISAQVSMAKIHRIPMKRISDSDFVQTQLSNAAKGLKQTYNLKSDGSIVINDYQNSQFYGEMQLGTPGQTFNVIYDTGSSDLWVAGKDCDRSCGRHATYDSSASSSYQANGTIFEIMYGSGPVSGYQSFDKITWGGFEVSDQEFAEVTDASGLGAAYKLGKFDGILGLAFPILSVNSATPAFQNTVSQGLIDNAEFSFYLGNCMTDKGELLLGGTDPELYEGEFNYVPLSSATYWEIELGGFTTDGVTYGAGDKAIVDSGTSLLTGPSKDVEEIAKAIGAKPFVNGEYMVSCEKMDTLPDFTFTVGGQDYVLTAKDYLIPDGDMCLLGMIGLDVPRPNGPLWIMGDIFMRKYYTVFDVANERVGFATAVHPHCKE